MPKQTLVYKRTHEGDPNSEGIFGCRDCMRGVRDWDFEAVIGVGGQGPKAEASGIAKKLTWIGIGPHKKYKQFKTGEKKRPLVTFDKFIYFGVCGQLLESCAPNLAKLMYVKRARNVMTFDEKEQDDVDRILAMVDGTPLSVALVANETTSEKICQPRRRRSPKC